MSTAEEHYVTISFIEKSSLTKSPEKADVFSNCYFLSGLHNETFSKLDTWGTWNTSNQEAQNGDLLQSF